MRNKITDLNNHLFAQLERLGDESISPEDLDMEIKRAGAMSNVASTIVDSVKTTVEAMKVMEKAGIEIKSISQGLLTQNPQ